METVIEYLFDRWRQISFNCHIYIPVPLSLNVSYRVRLITRVLLTQNMTGAIAMTYGAGYIYTSRAYEITASFVGVSLFGLFSFHVIFCVLTFPFSILMKYKRSISRTYWLEHFFETLNEVWLMNSYNVISKYYSLIILLYDNLWLLIKDIRMVVANANYTELVWKAI